MIAFRLKLKECSDLVFVTPPRRAKGLVPEGRKATGLKQVGLINFGVY